MSDFISSRTCTSRVESGWPLVVPRGSRVLTFRLMKTLADVNCLSGAYLHGILLGIVFLLGDVIHSRRVTDSTCISC